MPDPWDELAARTVNDQDRILFDEAANAARAGALRASYIAVWLSCAESIKRKFKETAKTDALAAKIGGEIDDKEARRQAVDAFVLDEAKKYGFVTDAEFAQLENVYVQRCIYGHPYEQAPLPAQLHAAAEIVVEYVLGRPTKLRHGYLSRQVDLLCKNRTYLDDHFPAVQHCAEIVHQRSSIDIHLWFLQKLWQEFAPTANDPSMAVFLRRIVWFTSAFLVRCDPSFFAGWDAVNDLTRYPFLSQTLAAADLFARVSPHAQDIVVGNLLDWAQSQAIAAKLVQDLNDAGALSPRQVERLDAALHEMPAHVLAPAGIHPRYYYKQIIQKLQSHNWHTQNPTIDVLRTLGPDGIADLDAAQQFAVGNNVLQAADGNANEAVSFLTEIGQPDSNWPRSFIEGIVTETLVNDDDKLRFKTRRAFEALLCLRAVSLEHRRAILEQVVDRVRRSSPKYQWSLEDDRTEYLAAVDRAHERDPDGLSVLVALRDAVNQVELPANE